ESPAQTLLQAIPTLDRVLLESAPRLDGALRRRLLLVRRAERHPISVRLQHRMEILDTLEVIPELRLAHLHHERRRLRLVFAPSIELCRTGRRRELPRRLFRPISLDLRHAPNTIEPSERMRSRIDFRPSG